MEIGLIILVFAVIIFVYLILRYISNNAVNKVSDSIENAFKKSRVNKYNAEHENKPFYLAEAYIDTAGFEFLNEIPNLRDVINCVVDADVRTDNFNNTDNTKCENNEADAVKIDQTYKFCGHCGVKITKDCKFCPKCGNKILE